MHIPGVSTSTPEDPCDTPTVELSASCVTMPKALRSLRSEQIFLPDVKCNAHMPICGARRVQDVPMQAVQPVVLLVGRHRPRGQRIFLRGSPKRFLHLKAVCVELENLKTFERQLAANFKQQIELVM